MLRDFSPESCIQFCHIPTVLCNRMDGLREACSVEGDSTQD
jgi:hypothetical protein